MNDKLRRSAAVVGLLLAAGLSSLLLPQPTHAALKRVFLQKRYLQVTSGTGVRAKFRRQNKPGNLIVVYVV